jgi:Asp-tRNA(Asn)/Glu-tRNA(Gln) amidotransferase A subunit family amidase
VAALATPRKAKPLAGMRIGVIRELLVKDSPGDAAVSDGISNELKVLKELGAEVVETVDPKYPDDPSIPNMAFTFNDAIAEILPFQMPEISRGRKTASRNFQCPATTSPAANIWSHWPHTKHPCRPI